MHATLRLLPALLALAACAGDGSGTSSHGGFFVVTEDPETPFFTVGESGNIVFFHVDPALGRPSGLTLLRADGKSGVLAVDPATGHPVHWVADGYVWTFSNVRPELGLLDVGLIAPDGSTGQVRDMQVPPVDPVSIAPAMTMRITEDDVDKLQGAVGALGVGVSLTVCVGTGILAAGTAVVGTLTFPPAVAPLLEVSGTATASACASALVSLMALRPENTTAVRVQETMDDEELLEKLAKSVKDCAVKRSTWACLMAAKAATDFASGQTVNGVLTEYVRLRDGEARAVPFQVYCCSGPSQVKVNDPKAWRASVVEGLGKVPFRYTWDFGDGSGETWLDSEQYALTASHAFATPGLYPVHVGVEDRSGNRVESNAYAPGPLDTFYVEAYGPLELTSGGQPLRALAGREMLVDVTITGGRRPYRFEVDGGDGAEHRVGDLIDREARLPYTYTERGEYQLRVTITDADGESKVSAAQTVTVTSVVGGCEARKVTIFGGFVTHMCWMYTGSEFFEHPEEMGSLVPCTVRAGFVCPEAGAVGACLSLPGGREEAIAVYYEDEPMAANAPATCGSVQGIEGIWLPVYEAPE